MNDPIIFVCSTTPLHADRWTTCAKCGRFLGYTSGAYDFARKKYPGHELIVQCEFCSASAFLKQSDAEIRAGREVARAGVPARLLAIYDSIEITPDNFRSHFRKKVPQ